MDLLGGRRRRARTVGAGTGRTLEVGIGPGRTIDRFGPDVDVTGIDLPPAMLARAHRRAARRDRPVRLELADVTGWAWPAAR